MSSHDTNTDMSALALPPALADWHLDLAGDGPAREVAAVRLRELLLRAARFEVFRRSGMLPQLSPTELDDLADEAASDAAMSVLRRLDDFRGESRFETWAYKFALLEAAVKVRRRAWRGREVTLDPDGWERFAAPEVDPEHAELFECVRDGIKTALTPHQREVLVAAVLDGVPIDVIAERLDSNRNAVYKTIHDARTRLRAYVADAGYLEVT